MMAVSTRTMTIAEYETFLAQPESAHRAFELIDGIIREKLVTELHGILAGNLIAALKAYLKQNRIGRAAVEARHRPLNSQDQDRLPDVSVVLGFERPIVERGAAPFMPDLAAEIQSPDDANDSQREMMDTALFYLANGVSVVWLVYPKQHIVEVLTPTTRQLLTEADTLTCADLLPGFSMPVADVFDLV